jgi:hypothetical protein
LFAGSKFVVDLVPAEEQKTAALTGYGELMIRLEAEDGL